MVPVRIERGLARRIDRLARRAHAFHRFAHHPLCLRYEAELIALGRRRRVCRGCVAAVSGTACGAVLGCLVPLRLEAPVTLALAGAFVALTLGVWAGLQRRDHVRAQRGATRLAKLWTRALPLASAGCSIVISLRLDVRWGLALSALIASILVAALAAYRRSGPDRSPCVTCPEREASVPCSGFRDIVRAERAFVRRSRQLLDRAGARG